MYETADNQTVAGIFDSGSIRLDDILRRTITQYDILRTLPFENNLYSLLVPGQVLAKILTNGRSAKGSILFLSYCGVETKDDGKTWLINGQDISKTGLNYNVATMSHARRQIKGLEDPTVIELKLYNITQTKSLINYLPTKYPPC
jgi:2',3'-cyclic-nucleotide 2'-phosphodiesterase (5'-nucleotidase family)